MLFRSVLFESATIGILVHDPQTVDLLEVNPKAMEDLGVASVSEIRPGAFFGESPYSLVEMKQWFRKTREQGPQRFEWLVTRHDGSQRWHDTSLQYVKLDGHARILAMAIDITERKIAEESLRQLNNLLEEDRKSTRLNSSHT